MFGNGKIIVPEGWNCEKVNNKLNPKNEVKFLQLLFQEHWLEERRAGNMPSCVICNSNGENNTRLDMRGNGQRPTPSILLDSCFELNWLSSAVGNRCSRSKPIVRHIQEHAWGLECNNSTSSPAALRVPVLKQALDAGSQLEQLTSRQQATAQSRHVMKIIYAWIFWPATSIAYCWWEPI